MTDEHERFEELAVGHVLGGLDAADAATFRAHLVGCRNCRLHVAELRDIAAELAAAEREERQHERLRTEVVRRSDDSAEEPAPAGPRVAGRHLAVMAVIVMLFAAGMAFWNLHLRTAAGLHADIAEERGSTLLELATGLVIPAELADGITGVVTVDGHGVAFSVAGIPPMAADERVVAWLVGTEDGAARVGLFARAGQLGDSVFAGHMADRGASELVITLEGGEPSDQPQGRQLVRAQLRPEPDGG